MTVRQDPPPQTRRQAREAERARAKQQNSSSRRATTTEPTAAGDIPPITAAAPAAAEHDQVPHGHDPAEEKPASKTPGEQAPDFPSVSGTRSPRYEGASFDSLLAPPDDDADEPGLFRPELPAGASEPITEPVASIPITPGPESSKPSTTPSAGKALTRRELRALKQAREANERAAHGGDESAESDAATESATGELEDAAPIMHRGSFVMPPSASEASDADQADPEPESPADGAPAPVPQRLPAGHWSNVADHEQGERQSGHGGVGPTTTSALILPSIPNGDVNRPISSTGEILVTGSIEVPHSFATPGHRPSRFDSSDIDRLFDQSEDDADTGTVAPVRASRAISTHTSTRGVIAPQQRHGVALPMVLAITAGVLALGVIGLLVAGFVLRIF